MQKPALLATYSDHLLFSLFQPLLKRVLVCPMHPDSFAHQVVYLQDICRPRARSAPTAAKSPENFLSWKPKHAEI